MKISFVFLGYMGYKDDVVVHWPAVPREGEGVILDDGGYRVLRVDWFPRDNEVSVFVLREHEYEEATR